MTNKNMIQTKWLHIVALSVMFVIAPLLVVGCGTNLCSVFNCDTLFFMQDFSQALQNLSTTQPADDHVAGDGDMNMDGSNTTDGTDHMAGDGHSEGG